jgi:hypothetical protein
MSKKEKRSAAGETLDRLFDAGDHRAARREANRILGLPESSGEDKAAAQEAMDRLKPEPGALLTAGVGLAFVLFVIYFGVLVQ